MTTEVGNLIKQLLKENNMSVVAFAAAIDTTRENVYAIFKRNSFDSDLLWRMSIVLNHNLFTYYDNSLEQELMKLNHNGSSHSKEANVRQELDWVIAENTNLKRENELLRELNELLKSTHKKA
jgi:hypothetical protein